MNDKGIIVKSLYGVLLLWCISTGARAQIDAPGYPLASGISQTPAHMESGDIVYRQLNPEVPYGGGTGVNRLLSDALASFGGYHVGLYLGFAYPNQATNGNSGKGLSYEFLNHSIAEEISRGYNTTNLGLFHEASPWVGAFDGAGNLINACGANRETQPNPAEEAIHA